MTPTMTWARPWQAAEKNDDDDGGIMTGLSREKCPKDKGKNFAHSRRTLVERRERFNVGLFCVKTHYI